MSGYLVAYYLINIVCCFITIKTNVTILPLISVKIMIFTMRTDKIPDRFKVSTQSAWTKDG